MTTCTNAPVPSITAAASSPPPAAVSRGPAGRSSVRSTGGTGRRAAARYTTALSSGPGTPGAPAATAGSGSRAGRGT
ncbi:hypothetical protein CXR04_12075 [Streptomyces sp. CMB-StM0423]|nr:hypothetical protein CXR04_12075 [Streptomyces sp. CMB-StM0423]